MIDKSTVDRIYAAANIVEVVGDFVTLKKKGINYQACCPFHSEKTPSFVVSPAKGMFKCFGCGKGGNAVSFIMEHEGMDYVQALKYVARKYGIEVQEKEYTPEEKQLNDDRESMMVTTAWAADFFRETLVKDPEGRNIGLSYFRERGFTDATIEKFGLGFCPSAGDAFSKAALKNGYKEEFLVRTGLSIKRDDGTFYDRFAGRVIFPIHGISGRPTAFGGRTLRTDKKVAKYLNSPESEIYHKSNVLYGLFFAKKAVTQADCCILVEGYTDVISMHQSGVENVVASSGTSLTEEQIKLISRFTKNVTVIYDGDPAGIKASLRGIDMILREGLNVRVVLLPDGEDPDSFARSHTASELAGFISDNEQDFISFKTKLLMSDTRKDPIKRATLISDIVESISVIPDAISRNVYLKECSMLMNIDEQVLGEEIRRKRKNTVFPKDTPGYREGREALDRAMAAEPSKTQRGGAAGSGMEELERELITYLLRYGRNVVKFGDGDETAMSVARAIISDMEEDGLEFANPVYNTLYREYKAVFDENPDADGDVFPIARLMDNPDPRVGNAVVDMMMRGDSLKPSKLWERNLITVPLEEDKLHEAVPRAITLYKTKIVEQMINSLKSELQGAGGFGDEQLEILRRIDALNAIRNNISKKYSRVVI